MFFLLSCKFFLIYFSSFWLKFEYDRRNSNLYVLVNMYFYKYYKFIGFFYINEMFLVGIFLFLFVVSCFEDCYICYYCMRLYLSD